MTVCTTCVKIGSYSNDHSTEKVLLSTPSRSIPNSNAEMKMSAQARGRGKQDFLLTLWGPPPHFK